ncbi:AAA family ATPase [Niveibacterium sp. SC-1]|uniref:AAA family ATPase n=1 Tax=Niveibacterium sp. SC-1 TaxID=3135646 RepID=UPI00311ECFAF
MSAFDGIERGASVLDGFTRQDDGPQRSRLGALFSSGGTERPLAASAVVSLVCAADVQTEPVRWLWPGWIAAGKLAIIGGAPGCGKTTIAIALAAVVSRGGTFPDGVRCALPGNVLIWSGEDDPSDTLKPRLLAAGADVSRCHFIDCARDEDGPRPFDPARDMAGLDEAAQRLRDVRLLIADPIVSAVAGDSHKNAEVRRGLQPIVDFAIRHGCAVLGVTHFTKGTSGRDPVERITGSLAFAALARLVLVAAKERTGEDERRVFVRAKNNIGPDGGGFAYALDVAEIEADGGTVTSSRVTWGEPIEGEAREILAIAEADEDDERRTQTDEAEDFLRQILASGARQSKDIEREAKAAGIGTKPLRNARQRLGIKPKKASFSGGWIWSLPGCEVAQDAQVAPNSHTEKQGNIEAQGQLGGEDLEAEVIL